MCKNCRNNCDCHLELDKKKKPMFDWTEKQGRLCITIDCYLEMDLDNEELEKVFNEMEIHINHLLIADIDVQAKTE